MLFWVINVSVLAATAIGTWWLSGFDSHLTGDNNWKDSGRRGFRCGFTLLVIEAGFYGLWRYWMNGDRPGGLLYLVTLPPLILLWRGCISEAGAQYFLHLIDPQDTRPYDPKAAVRELDAVGHLIRNGHKQEAIRLCRQLLQNSPANRSALELALHHLGAPPPESPAQTKPLAQASRLRQAGKFAEAEKLLRRLFKRQPSNVDAALMLIRLYTQDTPQPKKAAAVLRSLENTPYISPAYVDFARRFVTDLHTGAKPRRLDLPEEPLPESVEELVAKKYLGTAIEILERRSEAEPKNFDTWLKLAEVHGLHCANMKSAEKTVRQIEANPAFTPEQKQQAQMRLAEWRNQIRSAGSS